MNPKKLYHEGTSVDPDLACLRKGDKVIAKLKSGAYTAYEIVTPRVGDNQAVAWTCTQDDRMTTPCIAVTVEQDDVSPGDFIDETRVILVNHDGEVTT